MKLLDRYILRELAGPFLFGMVLFITVIVSGEYLFKLTSYIANGAPFLPVLELYMYNASQHLSGIADIDTGLKFLDKSTVVPYSSTKSRYEGTGTSPGVQKS